MDNVGVPQSLTRQLCGPSALKAGVSGDDSVVQRILEVSRGSLYFENEQRRHERASRRIAELLARRDAVLQAAPRGSAGWRATEAEIDRAAAAMEASRDLSRTILHCDMDMFFAAVELRSDPSLEGKKFAVGSSVISTASYEARASGVRSGMGTHVAKALCPELIVLDGRYDVYQQYSKTIMDVLRKYDDNIYPRSLDEAFVDVTDYCERHQVDVDDVVTELRKRVTDATGLTVSVGIAPNMMLAKIVSDYRKPNGQYRLPADPEVIRSFMAELPVRKVPGIGGVTERVLESLGVATCGEIWERRVELRAAFGNIDMLLRATLGLGETRVKPPARHDRRSCGRERTFPPTTDVAVLHGHLRDACRMLAEDLAELGFAGRTLTLVGKRASFQRFSRARSLPAAIASAEAIYEAAERLLHECGTRPALRLIGVRMTGLVDLRRVGPLAQWLEAPKFGDAKLWSQ
ncbi:DNA-directed DNA polymerase [Malassezia cuniculi]|uniref:DNA polymerase kappa n=1 Tax=Malassezia cuniculi TaxID=948313 RepID=A0AAF0EYF6_9BASI|nr:DNA-directed DNA polymerase [Malassezia cuniculi]